MGQELTKDAQTHEDVTKRVSGFTPKQVEMIRYISSYTPLIYLVKDLNLCVMKTRQSK